jgi:hypothetical protein
VLSATSLHEKPIHLDAVREEVQAEIMLSLAQRDLSQMDELELAAVSESSIMGAPASSSFNFLPAQAEEQGTAPAGV